MPKIQILCLNEPVEALLSRTRALGVSLERAARIDAAQLATALAEARTFPGLTLLLGAPETPVAAALDASLPGPGEWLRREEVARRGPAGALAVLQLGPCGAGLLGNLSPEAMETGLPFLTALLPSLLPEPPVEAERAERPGLHSEVQELTAAPAPAPEAHGGGGWLAALEALGGALERGGAVELPEAFERLAPARNVLESAGATGRVRLPSGRRYLAFGFPDLLRPSSKVLLVGEGSPWPEVVALHRHPRRVGTCIEEDGGLLPGRDRDPDGPAIERTGAPPPGGGTLFALDGAVVYLQRGSRVLAWDGRKEREEGPASSTLAGLMLRWSQR